MDMKKMLLLGAAGAGAWFLFGPRLYRNYSKTGEKPLEHPFDRTKNNHTVRDPSGKLDNAAPINRVTVTATGEQTGVQGKLASQ